MVKTAGLEDFGWELGEIFKQIDQFEENKQEYVSKVDSYKKGEVSPTEMKSAVYEMAQSVHEIEEEVMDAELRYSIDVGAFETTGSEVPLNPKGMNDEMAESILEEGFEILTSHRGVNYPESATENELAYHSFVESYGNPEFTDENLSRGEQIKQIIDKMVEKMDEIEEEAADYQREFLYDNLGKTISGAYLDIQDGCTEAVLDQEVERKKAEEIRKNPRDAYIGRFESREGVEDLNEARKDVREKTPRGKLENEGPLEEEIEMNNERIERKREEVRERDDRGIY